MKTKGNSESGAVFSDCERYRYRLWREWDASKPKACFVMLNPSTATHEVLDPTVSRCKKRAQMLGYGGFNVVNIFALRSTDPKMLYKEEDPGGDIHNSVEIYLTAKASGIVICGWGSHGKLKNRGPHIARQLQERFPEKTHYLKLNSDGSPAHPLYLPYELKPVLWSQA
jgi:hypothetical protein